MIYNVVLISTMQKSDSVIHIYIIFHILVHYALCYCSVAKSRPTLYDSLDCSMPGFLALNYLPENAQVHVH